MSVVAATLAIRDNFSNTLNRAAQGTQRVIRSMQVLQTQSARTSPARMFTGTSSAISGASQRLDVLNKKQREAAKNAEQVKSAWSGVRGVMVAAVAGLATGAGSAMQAVDSYTNNNARLNGIKDEKKPDENLQKMVFGAAQRSGTGYSDMVGTVSKLALSAGGSFNGNNEIVAFSELMQKSFAVNGASAAEQQAGMDQVTQAMASGKLEGAGFESMMASAPMMVQAIADFTGKSTEELKKLSAEGLISADLMKSALLAASDEIEAKFEALPRTFEGTWTRIKNFAAMSFAGVMQSISNFLNSDIGSAMVTGIMVAIATIASGVEGLINLISTIASFVESNWAIIGPILTVAAVMAITYLISLIWAWGAAAISMLWAWGSAALINGFRAFAAFMLANWPILLIGAAIGILIVILNNMGVTFDQVLGFIGGALFGLYAFFYNIVIQVWNIWSSFAEFFANVFNHPVYSIKRLFVNLANTVLDIVKEIAGAIDAVFGSNLASSVTGLQKTMDDWLGEMPEGYKVTQKLETKSITEYSSKGYQAGSDMAKGMQNKIKEISSQFDGKAKEENGVDKGPSKGSGAGMIPNVGKVGEVGQINSEVNIGEEDLQMMKDVAEMRYVQNFVTMTPTIAMNANISEKVDVNYVMAEMERLLNNELAMSAEGVYPKA
ncbi:tape measure protein [Paenibacillus arenosi]|uniref:Tape measure protein n=1 Tax=Paenibacillus arenosi TaxID=2774142 RepID=A0ABR9B0P0_9BACL|nr:tape measure protein [Paenibacillus arenosi]MBD8499967.1 tape measure protein [Paenibacillus arenosi]